MEHEAGLTLQLYILLLISNFTWNNERLLTFDEVDIRIYELQKSDSHLGLSASVTITFLGFINPYIHQNQKSTIVLLYDFLTKFPYGRSEYGNHCLPTIAMLAFRSKIKCLCQAPLHYLMLLFFIEHQKSFQDKARNIDIQFH